MPMAHDLTPLVEAALDQHTPTPALVRTLNALLVRMQHQDRLRPDATGKIPPEGSPLRPNPEFLKYLPKVSAQ